MRESTVWSAYGALAELDETLEALDSACIARTEQGTQRLIATARARLRLVRARLADALMSDGEMATTLGDSEEG